jgi:hypothetical protein
MCDKCVELGERIGRLRTIATQSMDAATIAAANELIKRWKPVREHSIPNKSSGGRTALEAAPLAGTIPTPTPYPKPKQSPRLARE